MSISEGMKVFLDAVHDEYVRARLTLGHGRMNSAHEGYAVILEELDEIWEEVRKKRADRDPAAMRKECIQLAAMSMAFALEVCDEYDGQTTPQ